MMKLRRLWRLGLAFVTGGLMIAGCVWRTGPRPDPSPTVETVSPAAPTVEIVSPAAPTVEIVSPAAGSSVPVNEPLTVEVSAKDADGPGVVRVELQIGDDETVTYEAGGPQPEIKRSMECMPSEEGETTLTVIAYREDGTASPRARISLNVVGPSVEPPNPIVRAQANQYANVREGPQASCPLVGGVNQGEIFPVTAVTDLPTDNWYHVAEPQGWVWEGNLSLLDDDSSLPRVSVPGCDPVDFCGDAVCSNAAGETCVTCPADCGHICPFCGDGEVNQSSEECDGAGCDTDQFCDENCLCQPIKCGNGILEPGERCDGAAGTCPTDQVCNEACTCVVPEPVCGNDILEGDEECGDAAASCAANEVCVDCTCVPSKCGNDILEGDEECDGAAASCAANEFCDENCLCQPIKCGNGILEPGEQCDGATDHCPPDKYCRDCECEDIPPPCNYDGICQPYETSGSCPDCCGDGVCSASESLVIGPLRCAQDCGCGDCGDGGYGPETCTTCSISCVPPPGRCTRADRLNACGQVCEPLAFRRCGCSS